MAQGEKRMSIEDLTQEEWDEHHKQLDKHLDGVEKRHIARLSAAMGFSREWVGLTHGELAECQSDNPYQVYRAIEAKLKKKNAPKREWVGLTHGELAECQSDNPYQVYRAIEAKLKKKNGG
jgi:hypothetical protein